MTELEKISDAEINGLVNAAIKKNKEDSMRSQTGLKAKTKDEALSRDAELKALESVLARRIIDRLKGSGQYGMNNVHYPYQGDLAAKINAIKAYHDVIVNYELQNAIANIGKAKRWKFLRVIVAIHGGRPLFNVFGDSV